MAWGSTTTSDSLSLGASMATFQASSVDLEVTLNPGERAHVQIDYDPQATPTEHCEWRVLATVDGTNYDDTAFLAGSIDKDASDPNALSFVVEGVYGFKLQARLIDTDGTDGGDDTATATAYVRKDGVSL